jgi:hypothetical protein
MQAGTAFYDFPRGNISSFVATKWLVFSIPQKAGTIIFYITAELNSVINMSKFFKWIKALFVAMINVCLLCGAGHVFDWVHFIFNKTSRAGRRIKRLF